MAVKEKPCGTCQGDGVIEVCPVGHTAACPCAGRNICCPDCDGSGAEPMSDEEISDLEGAADSSEGA